MDNAELAVPVQLTSSALAEAVSAMLSPLASENAEYSMRGYATRLIAGAVVLEITA